VPFRVTYEVSWPGDAGLYRVLPAEFDVPGWGTLTLTSSRAFVRDGLNIVAQTLEAVASEAGTVAMPSVRIGYLTPATAPAQPAREGDSPPSPPSGNDDNRHVLEADGFSVEVAPSRAGLLAVIALCGAGVIAAAVIGYAFWARRRGRGVEETVVEETSDWRTVEDALASAQRRRIEGKYYEFYCELSQAASLLPAAEGVSELRSALATRTKEVGYRGIRPQDDEMDGDMRAVQRAIRRDKEALEA